MTSSNPPVIFAGQSASRPLRRLPVAFCVDRNMIVPLHVATRSLLANVSSDCEVAFYLLLDGFMEGDMSRLRLTLDKVGKPYTVHLLKVPEIATARIRRLHGNYAPYYRLFLMRMIQEDRVLYLDADTVVGVDVSMLLDFDFGGKPLAAVLRGQAHTALDGDLLLRYGVNPMSPVLNSGVLLFNVSEWNQQNLTEQCITFCDEHGPELISHDQSVLNILLQGRDKVASLPEMFNTLLHYGREKISIEPGIWHFLASPKPFDLLGEWFNPYYWIYAKELRHTVVRHDRWMKYFRMSGFRRTVKLRRSYVRTLLTLWGMRN